MKQSSYTTYAPLLWWKLARVTLNDVNQITNNRCISERHQWYAHLARAIEVFPRLSAASANIPYPFKLSSNQKFTWIFHDITASLLRALFFAPNLKLQPLWIFRIFGSAFVCYAQQKCSEFVLFANTAHNGITYVIQHNRIITIILCFPILWIKPSQNGLMHTL